MVRKASQPKKVKIRRKRVADEGLKVDLLVRWNINEVTVEGVDGENNTEYEYDESELTVSYNGDPKKLDSYIENNKDRFVEWGKAKKDSVEIDSVDPFLDPSETIYASIKNIDASRTDKKYIEVERSIDGDDYNSWCYVTNSVLQAYNNNNIEVGDLVIIDFVDGDFSKPLVTDKVLY